MTPELAVVVAAVRAPTRIALDRMGVNARLMEPAIVAAARVRRFDGADTWTFLD